jgi:hypothetical protein
MPVVSRDSLSNFTGSFLQADTSRITTMKMAAALRKNIG